MAVMFPALSEDAINSIRSKAEGLIYRCCRDQLGPDIVVVHSLALIRTQGRLAPEDGEVDFVVFDPQRGALVMEVKGGGISYDPSVGRWMSLAKSGNTYPIKDPYRQGTQQKKEIVGQIGSHPKWPKGAKFVAGHSAFFPDVDNPKQWSLPHAAPDITGWKTDLMQLRSWVEKSFAYWRGSSNAWRSLGKDGMEIVRELYCQPITVRPLLAAALEEEKQIRIKLTEQQSWLMQAIRRRPRALICGGAGTGKTLLALERARSLAASGKRTLLVCFNRPLAEHLKEAAFGTNSLDTMTYHELCDWRVRVAHTESHRDLLAEARLTYPKGDKYSVQLPHALALANELSSFRYDAIVVDEAQDFKPEFWLPLKTLLRDEDESTFYVFFDHNQAIYCDTSSVPIDEAPFILTHNCRNTKHIHELAYKFYRGEQTLPPAIIGAPASLLEQTTVSEQAKVIAAEVDRLLGREKIDANDIAVLIVGSPKDLYYNAISCYKMKAASWLFEGKRRDGHVLVDTVARFKGLEAAIVVLWGIDGIKIEDYRELLYVGLSRSKSRLYLAGQQTSCSQVMRFKDSVAATS